MKNTISNLLVAAVLAAINAVALANETTEIIVYRSPSCGCCEKWIDHLKQNNFSVKESVTDDIQTIKTKYGVSAELASCHTAISNGYVIEGHVPAEDIKNLLKTKPDVVGISVPGMPMGTPGMEMAGKKEAYDVLSFGSEHPVQIFRHH